MNSAKSVLTHAFEQADIHIGGKRPWDIQVHDERFYTRVVHEGTFGAGESYVDGWWDCDALDEVVARTLQEGFAYDVTRGLRQVATTLRDLFFDAQKGKRGQAVANLHYNLDQDMYEAMLGKSMNYSCAYWRNATDLDQAQEQKMELICRKLRLKKGDRVLDVGCGWGALAKYMAEKYGCSVVGITISDAQCQYAQKASEGLPVDIRLLDYRSPEARQLGPFDAIVSVGMFEHVGCKNHRRFMDYCFELLPDHGLLLLQTFGRTTCKPTDPWVDKYVFPNSYIPSIAEIDKAICDHLVMEDWHNFGADYDRSLMAWCGRFEDWANEKWRADNPRQYRKWRFYLLSFAGSFRARTLLQLWQIVLSKHGVPSGYLSVR